MPDTPLWRKLAAIEAVAHTINFLTDYPDDVEGPPMLEKASEAIQRLKEYGWTGAAAELEIRLAETERKCQAARQKKNAPESDVSGSGS